MGETMIPCEKHAEREGTLAVDLPSIGMKRYMCAECRNAMLDAISSSPRKAARDGYGQIWESFGGRQGITDHAYLNPNAQYERSLMNNKDIVNDK